MFRLGLMQARADQRKEGRSALTTGTCLVHDRLCSGKADDAMTIDHGCAKCGRSVQVFCGENECGQDGERKMTQARCKKRRNQRLTTFVPAS